MTSKGVKIMLVKPLETADLNKEDPRRNIHGHLEKVKLTRSPKQTGSMWRGKSELEEREGERCA